MCSRNAAFLECLDRLVAVALSRLSIIKSSMEDLEIGFLFLIPIDHSHSICVGNGQVQLPSGIRDVAITLFDVLANPSEMG